MKFIRNHIFSIIAAVIILILSVMRPSSFPHVAFGGADKLVHIFMYAGLIIALFCDRYILQRQHTPGSYSITFLFALSYSILMEVIQHFLPWRSFSLLDILANTVGVFIGLIFYALHYNIYLKKK